MNVRQAYKIVNMGMSKRDYKRGGKAYQNALMIIQRHTRKMWKRIESKINS